MVYLTLLFIAYKQHCNIYGPTPRRIFEVTVPYTCIKIYKSFSSEYGAADCMVLYQHTPPRMVLYQHTPPRMLLYQHTPPRNVFLKPAVGENDFVISVPVGRVAQLV